MSNSMNINGLTRTSARLLKEYQSRQSTIPAGGFLAVAEQVKKSDAAGSAGALPQSGSTMTEYKAVIFGKISQLPVHPSRMMDSVSVRISEAGFEAMKNDPEYEEWVLNQLRESFMSSGSQSVLCGGDRRVYYIGAAKEEYRSESWDSSQQDSDELFEEKAAGDFWEQRMESHKKFQELQREAAIKRWYLQRRLRGLPISAAELMGCL